MASFIAQAHTQKVSSSVLDFEESEISMVYFPYIVSLELRESSYKIRTETEHSSGLNSLKSFDLRKDSFQKIGQAASKAQLSSAIDWPLSHYGTGTVLYSNTS